MGPVCEGSLTELQAWSLECLDGAGPCVLQSPPGGVLRVGRAAQAAELWERLLPDEAARASVSREHFEVRGPGTLRNLSARGTLVNGAAVHGAVELRTGDVVAIGMLASEYGSRPALHFRFAAEGSAAGRAASTPTLLARKECGGKASEARFAHKHDWSYGLEWIGVAGQAETLAHTVVLPINGVGHAKILRVGRSIQSQAFWETVVQDGALRSAISREHFEVQLALDEATCTGKERVSVTLVNLSSAGTLLNGALIRDRSEVNVGDFIAMPRPREAGEGGPIVQFRLTAATPQPATDAWLAGPAVDSTAGPAVGPLGPAGPAELAAVATPVRVGPGQAPRAAPLPEGAALPEAPGPAAVVKISIAELPPPFALECSSSLGLSPELLASLPRPQRALEASCSRACLRVGRAVQPPDFWATLLPDETLRNTVSREHFEITLEDGRLLLLNFSASGTLVNNKCIDDRVRVLHGDRIGIGSMPGVPAPAIWFTLTATCADEGLGPDADGRGASLDDSAQELGGAGTIARALTVEPPLDSLGGTMPPVPSEGLASTPLARELPRMLPTDARLSPESRTSSHPRFEGGKCDALQDPPCIAPALEAHQPLLPTHAGRLVLPRHGR